MKKIASPLLLVLSLFSFSNARALTDSTYHLKSKVITTTGIQYFQLTVVVSGGSVTATTQLLLPDTSVYPSLYGIGAITFTDTGFVFPSASGKWIWVPFDSSLSCKTVLNPSSGGGGSCDCKKANDGDAKPTGTCEVYTFGIGGEDCKTTNCSGCCEYTALILALYGIEVGSGVLIQADSITFNGSTIN